MRRKESAGPPSQAPRKPRIAKPDEGVSPLPPRQMKTAEAAQRISSVVGVKISPAELVQLHFPAKALYSMVRGGVEFYDAETRRPSMRPESESVDSVEKWVNRYYLSFFRKGGQTLGRLIYKEHPLSPRIIEQVVDTSDPARGIRAFITAVARGESI